MSDPKQQNYDPEAATFVPGGGSPARTPSQAPQAVKTPMPDPGEAATMLEGALPPLAPITR